MASQSSNSRRAISRRRFAVAASGLAVSLASMKLRAQPAPPSGQKLRAAVIGHTGRGNYGHGLDMVFQGRPGIEVVAVADAHPEGRAKAAARIGAARQYSDYREMLEKERPQLVSIAPRWTGQHHAMGLAALRVGAHIYMEKPFTRTLAEADELLREADRAGLKISVAHQMRLAPNILHLKQAVEEGLIGELLEIRAHGKQDKRAGGEDLVVLGTHLFDLVRFFAGDPLWCMARVLHQGRDITIQDARAATEDIGPVAGDEIHAQFAFPNGVNVTYTSRARNQGAAGPWGIELIGSKGTARILADIPPRVFRLHRGEWKDAGRTDEWLPLEGDPTRGVPAAQQGFPQANARVVDDWLEAIRAGRQPVCSGHAAMKSLEMIMAVFQAGLNQARVPFPLARREHPLIA